MTNWHLWAALLLHLAVVLPLARLLPAYIDEIYSLRTATHGLLDSLRLGVSFERQAPVYFGVLNLWLRISRSVEFARLFSVLCTVCALLLLNDLARLLFDRKCASAAALLFALNPFVVFAATEARVYAFEICLTALILHVFSSYYLLSQGTRRTWLTLALLAAFSVYSQYHLGFLLLSLCIALIMTGRYRQAVSYISCMVIALILLLPVLTWITAQVHQPNGATSDRYPLAEATRFWIGLIRTFVFPSVLHLAPSKTSTALVRHTALAIQLLLLLGVVAGFVSLHRRGKAVRATTSAFWCCVLLGMAFVFAAAGATAGRLVVMFPRYWVGMVVPSCLAISALLSDLGMRRLLLGTLSFFLVTNALDLLVYYRKPAKFGDSIRVAEFIQAHEAPGEPIVVFPNQHAEALSLYYRGPNRLVPIPNHVRFDVFDMREDSMQSESQITAALSRINSLGHPTWLVFEPFDGGKEASFHPEIVQRYFERCYRAVQSRVFFNGLTVRHLVPVLEAPDCGIVNQ